MSTRASPPPPTVDDMLDWMRDRDRATKRYQQECHQQWAMHSPRLQKRHDNVETPRGASLLLSPRGEGGMEQQQQQQQQHPEVVDVVEVLPRELQSTNGNVSGSRSPRSPYAALSSSSPTGAATGRRSTARSSRIRELEHEELQDRVRAMRRAIVERDDTIASTQEHVRLLKARERVLTATLLQNSIRHAESFAILRREGLVPAAECSDSSMGMGGGSITDIDLDADVAEEEGEGTNGPAQLLDVSTRYAAPPAAWWRQNPFTTAELALFGDIGRRIGTTGGSGGAPAAATATSSDSSPSTGGSRAVAPAGAPQEVSVVSVLNDPDI